MSLKRLHSDDKIIGILDAISSKTGETYENVTTTQMAALIRNIPLGAKEVWIGEQAAYNQIPASEIDPEICYIIMARDQIVRCYAGSVIIYDEQVTWDYVVNNRVITPGVFIDTGISVETADAMDLTWECYFKASNIAPFSSLGNPPLLGYDNDAGKPTASLLPTSTNDSSYLDRYHHWWLEGSWGIVSELPTWLPNPYTDHLYIHVSKPEANGSILTSYFDSDNTEEWVNMAPFPASSGLYTDGRKIVFGQLTGNISYNLEEFKFRWLT